MVSHQSFVICILIPVFLPRSAGCFVAILFTFDLSLMTRFKLTGAIIVVAVVLSLGLSSCGKKNTQSSTRNQVVWWQLSDIERLNPYTSTDAAAAYVQAEIWEALNTSNPRTLELIPSLCSLPEVSTDHLLYTYTMEPRAKWSDGQPVTSADIIFSMKAVLNPLVINSQALRGYFANLDSVYNPGGDITKVAFHLNQARYDAANVLGGGYVKILPKHVLDPKNLTDKMSWADLKNPGTTNPSVKEFATWFESSDLARDPKYQIGSGPYVFKGWVTNDRLVLTRNPNYWGQNITWNEAYPDTLIFKTINDQNAALTALKARDLDIIDALKPEQYLNQVDTVAMPFLRKDTVFWNNYTFIAWNNRKPLFVDKNVRKALTMLIDRDRIQTAVLKNLVRKDDGPIASTQPNFDPSMKQAGYNVEEAKRLLKEAGWADTDGDGVLDKMIDGKKVQFDFTFQVNSGNEVRKQILLIVSEALRGVGIKASVQPLEWSVFLENTKSHNYEACYGAWAGNATEDDIFQLWHSSQIDHKGSNYYQYSSPIADHLMEQIKQEFDQTKRYQLWYQLQHTILDDQPVSFLFTNPQFIAMSNRFDNVEFFRSRPCFDPRYWVVRGATVKRSPNAVPMGVKVPAPTAATF
jgi:peptide/nickel transport system substrate-binding protein